MPTHGYTADGHPPTVLDHLLAHCFELLICAFAMLGGTLSIFAAVSSRTTVSPSLDKLQPLLAGIVGVVLLAGGVLVWRGLFDDSDDLMTGWRYERFGLILSAAGWGSYGVTIWWNRPLAILSWGLCAFIVLASLLRIWATVRSEKRTRKAIQ